jgi:hypothetical protein
VLAEFKTVDVRRRPVLKGEDQLVAGTVEGAHATVVLRPDNQILQLGIKALAGGEHLADVR